MDLSRVMTPPNFLFICCDDLNDALEGLGGHPQAKTPNLDRLMQRGLRFTNAQVNAPICGPSRSSFLSGLAPWKTGYFGYNFTRDPWWNNPNLKDSRTFMEHLGDHGYRVFGTGKIFHNGQEKIEVWKDGHGHKVDWGPWSWDGQKPGSGWGSCVSHHTLPPRWDAEMLFASLADIPKIPPNPETGAPGYTGWRHGDGTPFRYVSETDRDLMHDERNAEWASSVLARTDLTDPFLLCLGIGRPHSPLIAPQEFFDLFPLESIELAEVLPGDIEDCGQVFRDGHTNTKRWGFDKYRMTVEGAAPDGLRKWTQAYLACVAYADAQIGKVLDALEASPYQENTYVIVTSDNGYHMGEKDYLFKNSCWEESDRVPFLWAGPGIPAKSECPTPVSLIDLFPTLNDLAGVSNDVNAKTNGLTLDGHSLRPLLENPAAGAWSGPDVAITAVGSDTPLDAGEPGQPEDQHYSVRSETHRYIRYHNGEEELYDHQTDPYEWHNQATDPAQSAIKAALRQRLGDLVGIPLSS